MKVWVFIQVAHGEPMLRIFKDQDKATTAAKLLMLQLVKTSILQDPSMAHRYLALEDRLYASTDVVDTWQGQSLIKNIIDVEEYTVES